MQGNGSALRVTAERHFIAGDKRLCLVEVGQAGSGLANKLTHQELPVCVELRKLFDNISKFVGRFIGKAVDGTCDEQESERQEKRADNGFPFNVLSHRVIFWVY